MDAIVISSDNRDGGGEDSNEDRITKKVSVKELKDDIDVNMVVDLCLEVGVSWKDKLLGGTEAIPKTSSTNTGNFDYENFNFVEGDILKFIANKISAINFSNRIQKLLVKDMETTMVLEEIESLVGKVARLDIKMDSDTRGRFARMTIYVDLEKSLVSQILNNGRIQRVEFEALLAVCFACGYYGHLKNLCPSIALDQCTVNGNVKSSSPMVEGSTPAMGEEPLGPWMIIKRISRHN
ncbi:hypothetical protein PVK06_039183 [Gossypium arboreum]|uniref:CCHC-type domain-containing protein n=1 Tax=Gossypium arboreum TaxID=29729 RepID=A0ABR0N265_GOSAR|nr:hypothetical protein PVK06_039183 [Gossypium arboreum]